MALPARGYPPTARAQSDCPTAAKRGGDATTCRENGGENGYQLRGFGGFGGCEAGPPPSECRGGAAPRDGWCRISVWTGHIATTPPHIWPNSSAFDSVCSSCRVRDKKERVGGFGQNTTTPTRIFYNTIIEIKPFYRAPTDPARASSPAPRPDPPRISSRNAQQRPTRPATWWPSSCWPRACCSMRAPAWPSRPGPTGCCWTTPRPALRPRASRRVSLRSPRLHSARPGFWQGRLRSGPSQVNRVVHAAACPRARRAPRIRCIDCLGARCLLRLRAARQRRRGVPCYLRRHGRSCATRFGSARPPTPALRVPRAIQCDANPPATRHPQCKPCATSPRTSSTMPRTGQHALLTQTRSTCWTCKTSASGPASPATPPRAPSPACT